jgi:hypothetical protein
MSHDTHTEDAGAAAVRLHLNRRMGWGLYGTVTVAVFVLVVVGAVAAAQSGRLWMAAILVVVGLPMTAFLAVVTAAMVLPELNLSAAGVSGRTARGKAFDAPWSEVTIGAEEEDRVEEGGHCTIRMTIGEESFSINNESWVGFMDFIVMVVGTPAARSRLSPAAKLELVRLLHLER